MLGLNIDTVQSNARAFYSCSSAMKSIEFLGTISPNYYICSFLGAGRYPCWLQAKEHWNFTPFWFTERWNRNFLATIAISPIFIMTMIQNLKCSEQVMIRLNGNLKTNGSLSQSSIIMLGSPDWKRLCLDIFSYPFFLSRKVFPFWPQYQGQISFSHARKIIIQEPHHNWNGSWCSHAYFGY